MSNMDAKKNNVVESKEKMNTKMMDLQMINNPDKDFRRNDENLSSGIIFYNQHGNS